ncbi:MAG TPA: hypothetical protein VGM37_21210, partial [Armatimonadota bacterium]
MFTRTFSRLPFTVFSPETGGGSGGGGGQDPAGSAKPQAGDQNGGPGAPDNPAAAQEAADEKDPAKRLEAIQKELETTRKEAANYRTKLRKL